MKDELFNKIDKEILLKLSSEGSDFLNSFLEENGYDLQEIKDLSTKAYKKESFMMRAQQNFEKDQRLLELASEKIKEAINENLDKPIAFLKSLITENRLGVQYRNLDKLSVDDIRDIIKDQNLIELLEMLDKDE